MTNATKAHIIAAINAALGLLIVFNIVLTEAQIGAVDVIANAIMGAYVALTYKNSPKRKTAK